MLRSFVLPSKADEKSARGHEGQSRRGEETAEAKRTTSLQRQKVIEELTLKTTIEADKATIEVTFMTKKLDEAKHRLAVAKSVLAIRARVVHKCLDWFETNRCNEAPICHGVAKGGELCRHPEHAQKAKQCWKPGNMVNVITDTGFCRGKIPNPDLKKYPPPLNPQTR